ncbi:hypothetical protein [Streptomyces platensis]|uniref:hypothetical protein n=1 Tax=Streptomyces platensis TaxID=58346 RepID=UPI002E2730ED
MHPAAAAQAWTDQVVDGGLIVAPLPIADVPNMTVVAKVRVRGGEPVVEAVFTGGYIEATASPKGDLDLPGRWVDWENRVPGPSWISLAWRAQDDRLHTGARTALDRLLNAAHTPQDAWEGHPEISDAELGRIAQVTRQAVNKLREPGPWSSA